MKKSNDTSGATTNSSSAPLNTLQKQLPKLHRKATICLTTMFCLLVAIFSGILLFISSCNTSENYVNYLNARIQNIINQKLSAINTIASGLNNSNLKEEDDVLYYLNSMVASDSTISAIYYGYADDSYIIKGTLLSNNSFGKVTDSIWYKEALRSNNDVYISSPYQNASANRLCLTISQVIYSHNTPSGVMGVDLYIDDIVQEISLLNSSLNNNYSYGYIKVLSNYAIGKRVGSTEYFSLSSPIGVNMSLGANNTGTLSVISEMSFSGTDWKVIYVHSLLPAIITEIIIVAICIILSIVAALLFKSSEAKKLHKILAPIDELTSYAVAISNGDFTPVSEDIFVYKETAALSEALSDIVDTIKESLSQIVRVTNSISNGNINVNIWSGFKGEFSIIRDSLINIRKAMNKSAKDIDAKALSISEYTNEIDTLIQEFKEKSAKEAELLQSISGDLATINLYAHRINLSADTVKESVSTTGNNLVRGNREMKELLVSMEQIESSYNSIASLIYDINGLSEKTNLLSLNASIEAARMGENGKEFAQVADEIGMLSSACSKAINKIELLINDSSAAVDKGRDMLSSTSETITKGIQDAQNGKYNIDDMVFIVESQQDTIEHIDNTISELRTLIEE